MTKRSIPFLTSVFISLSVLASTGCRLSTHETSVASLGTPITLDSMERLIDQPGTITVETVEAARWVVPLSGLVNLDSPIAKGANLTERQEPISVYFYGLRHPERGLYLVDSGIEHALKSEPSKAVVNGLVAWVMNVGKMDVIVDTSSWLSHKPMPPAGVFLTHLHPDHTMGLIDVPKTTRIYAGPGEMKDTAFSNLVLQSVMDKEFAGFGALEEWTFPKVSDDSLAVLDVFGDQMLFAISAPGHTEGSTAYLARTPTGPVLMVGDVCHTAWGWQHGVEPGSFTNDHPRNARSLALLRALATRHPAMKVKLGHQRLPESSAARADDQ